MNKTVKSYLSFTRTERLGLVCLSALLLMLIVVRATMYLWVKPQKDIVKEQKLQAAWETFKRNAHEAAPTADTTTATDYKDAYDDNGQPMPAVMDLNTADSSMLIRLKGIGPATAHAIIEQRSKKKFTDVDQLLEIRHFPDATFAIMKRHLRVQP